jgi:methylmalonyl-CoA/ethylmalonyl-CoA epimerase
LTISALAALAVGLTLPSMGAGKADRSEAGAATAGENEVPMFKLHHMGVVVRDLDEAIRIYSDIVGIEPDSERIQRFTGKANETAMVPIGRPEDFNSFELMEPIADHFLDAYIKADRAEGFFHLAVLVDNFDEKVEELKVKGYTVIVEETVDPFPGCELLREAYIMPEDSTRGVLFDLIDARTFPASEGGLAQ